MGDVIQKAEAQAVAEITERFLEPKVLELKAVDGTKTVQVLARPDGAGSIEVESVKEYLDQYLKEPERKKGTANLAELDSLIAHVNRFKDQDSALFADPNPSGPSIVAVLDYHRAGDGAPRFGEHRARYAFPLSDEWKLWFGGNKAKMTQSSFAEFIENRILDILDPSQVGEKGNEIAAKLGCQFASAARLLELSRGLAIKVNSRIKNAQNLQTGEVSLTFEVSHQDEGGAQLQVPGAFVVAIPVFRGGAPYQLAARLRYRASEGSITWFYELFRTDLVLDHAIKEACEQAKAETGLPLFMGTPEA